MKWSADELEILKRYYERMGAVGVAKLLPRKTPIVCYHKAQKLGLEKSESENVEIQQDAAEEIWDLKFARQNLLKTHLSKKKKYDIIDVTI